MVEINLEIGSRDMPVIDFLRKDLAPNGKLICIDKRGGWFFDSSHHFKHKYDLLVADGEKLPIASNSVDSIYAKDLFGAHHVSALTPNGGSVNENVGENLPQEWFRVCKPGARVVVMEFATPYPEKKLIKQFDDAGFSLIEHNKGWEASFVYKEGIRTQFVGGGKAPYSLVLKKD